MANLRNGFFNSNSDSMDDDSADSLLTDALLSSSLSLSRSTQDDADSDDTLKCAEKLICANLERRHGTRKLTHTSVSKICRALAKNGVDISDCDNFFRIALNDTIYRHIEPMSAKAVCNVIWALARIGFKVTNSDIEHNLNIELAELLIKTIYNTRNESSFQPQTCANLLWSFAALNFKFADIQIIVAFILDKILASLAQDPNLNAFAGKKDKGISQIKDFFAKYHKTNSK